MNTMNARDPKFRDYAYVARPLANAYSISASRKKKKIATLFLGEWTKILDHPIPSAGMVRVRFRGGEGYIDVADLSMNRCLEIFFIDVDQGDSILIQTPDDRRVLVDGGQSQEALEFIENKYRLDKPDNYIDFEAVVATHCDADHTQGLLNILRHPKIAVKRFYHNGLFRRKDKFRDPGSHSGEHIFGLEDSPVLPGDPELAPLMKKVVGAALSAGNRLNELVKRMEKQERWKGRIDLPVEGNFVFSRLDANKQYLPPFTKDHKHLQIEALWPRAEQAEGGLSYPFYGDAGKTVNGNSIVLSIRHGSFRILLTGDLNARAMADLAEAYAGHAGALRSDVYKAAHHGSQDFDIEFLKLIRPNVAVISSGDDRYDAFGHPRAVLMGTITRYSEAERPGVFCTELAACFSRLSAKERKQFREGRVPLYERSIKGIVHLRSDGRQMYLGTVHGRKVPEDPNAGTIWKWDIWPA
jgi:beta-lactamase superfamily II metal-dependent hydrolase